MKYEPTTMLVLLTLFLVTMFFGLYITQKYTTLELPYSIEPPEIAQEFSIPYFIFGILAITVVFILFRKLRFTKFLKIWFGLAIALCMSVSLSAFIGDIPALFVAGALTVIRLKEPDIYVHNMTEILLYGGLVSIFMPIFNVWTALILLICISIYDYIAVYVTKHMIMMAKSQDEENIFTGLVIRRGDEVAILGGGDVAFSLLFAATIGSAFGVPAAYITVYLVMIALAGLILYGKRGKFYPAMPFVTTACAASLIINMLLKPI